MLGDQREDLRNVHSALPVLAELKRARHQRTGIPLSHDDLALAGQRLARILSQRRLGIEGIEMADAATHEQRNHAGGTRGKVGLAGSIRVVALCFGIARAALRRRAQQPLLAQ